MSIDAFLLDHGLRTTGDPKELGVGAKLSCPGTPCHARLHSADLATSRNDGDNTLAMTTELEEGTTTQKSFR